MLNPSELANHSDIAPAKGEVIVAEHNQRFTRSIYTEQHQWFADESKQVGGDDYGPNPFEMLMAALGACTSMTVRIYAKRKEWPLDDIRVSLTHKRDNREGVTVDVFHRAIHLVGASLTEDQRQRMLDIANKCPVHKTLTGKIEIDTELL
jgi:putative redox protein